MPPAKRPKTFQGTVVSDKMPKTRVVEVKRYQRSPKYGKYLKRSKRFKAQDENNEYHFGDKVTIQEIRPLSREKRWKIVSKL